jgi:GntR family transcriptional regulator
MFLDVDIHPQSPVPIYEQIIAQVTFAIASGVLEPGARLPSVRVLGHQLRIHPNTVARAFQELERSGIISALRGLGMEVTQAAPRICRAERQEILRRRIRVVLREAVSSALTPEEIRRLVEEELARVNDPSHRISEKRS